MGGDFLYLLSFYIRCKEDCCHFFLSFLFQVEGGAGRGEAGQDGAGDDPPGQPRPPPGLALGLVRLGLRGGRLGGRGGQELEVVKCSKWSIRCFRNPLYSLTVKHSKLKLRHNKRSETRGVTLGHTQQC